MRHALKVDGTKLFTPSHYLTKNQIRSLFGRLSKKVSIAQRTQWMNNKEVDKQTTSSDEDNAEDYFREQQDQELEDLKGDEVDNALNCCSDNEYDSAEMDQT